MKVNKNNYEVWIIDYFDGKLSAAKTADLMTFLDLHPDLKEEFEFFDSTPVNLETESFSKKSELKKIPVLASREINEENYEEYFIAFYEKDLTEPENINLQLFLAKNPQLEKEFKFHGSLVLQADRSIVFEQKESLQKTRRVAVYWWSGAVAAMILMLFGIFSLLQNDGRIPDRNLTEFAISTIESEEIYSIGHSEKVHLDFISRPTPTITIVETELVTAEIAHENSAITTMFAAKPEIGITTLDLNSTFILPDFDDSEIVYAFAENTQKPGKKKNLLGKIIKNFATRATESTKNNSEKPNKKDPTFLKVLDQSILVFNTITGSDTELVKSYDNNGNLRHYQIDGQSLSWGKNISSPPNKE